MGELILLLFLAGFAYFIYVHIKFWKTLKREAPEVLKENSGVSAVKYVTGTQWIDYALLRKYREIGSPSLTKAGDKLCQAYMGFTGVIGYSFLIACLAILGIGIYVLYQYAF